MATPNEATNGTAAQHPVLLDVTIRTSHELGPPTPGNLQTPTWHIVPKELRLKRSEVCSWICVLMTTQEDLVHGDLLIEDMKVSEAPPEPCCGNTWESRPFGIWIARRAYAGTIDCAITEVDVLFGEDAIEPRPQWSLMQPLAESDHLAARLTVHYGRIQPSLNRRPILRFREDAKFKILQISDTHMVTGVGLCDDAIDANGKHLPESHADPLTVAFIEQGLDIEKPDLVVLTGDQLHHNIFDSQSALLKLIAPMIARCVPFAAVFGNHDDEGMHALSRESQMSFLQSLPFSLCESGPGSVDGIGNFCVQIFAPAPSQTPLSSLYFLDSHGERYNERRSPDYEHIKQSQMDWFSETIKNQRGLCDGPDNSGQMHLSMAFIHIPLPEFGYADLKIANGHRGERTEAPSFNSGFYNVLAKAGVSALGCGHDHVNDFCATLSRHLELKDQQAGQAGPWLCHAGAAGFGAYCSHNGKRYHRRMRVWELDAGEASIRTWKRVEYAADRVDEILIVDRGLILDPCGEA